MAKTKTNSNSITAILINKLNYKKSGFRFAMLEKWNLPNDTIFTDCTHSTINCIEMGNKEVDIVGISNSKYVILIEIKANLSENIQDSQKTDGQYVATAEKNKIPLKYIIPDGYYEIDKLPSKSKYVQIIKWSKIYEIAQETDNTGFTEDINNFVESIFSTNDILLNKGEVAMFLSPNEIKNVITLESKFEELVIRFAEERKYERKSKLEWGNWFTIKYNNLKKEIWIGFYNLQEASDKFLFMWEDKIKLKKQNKYKDKVDYWLYGSEVYVPILDENNRIPEFLFAEKAEEQQELFNKFMDYNIKKYFEMVE